VISQPVDDFVMSETEYKFVNDTVNTHSSTNQLEFGIFWIAEDKMVLVECSECCSAHSSSHLS
jgi:hypothetical protein